ncbi:hypothetical protein CSC78_03890 [Pseudoxanthomonas japonensis]|uniref:OmpA-like domain-containing protein n=2 Tax=Pseudoxanthomonas japonensis TaxID=69284 RepID=A0ABQ6ZKI2_9GAMM|nr:hypothetical protein CSC78_03890 [Pseudoxanthomonas japonensis]
MQIAAVLRGRRIGKTDRRKGRSGVFAAFALMALLALFAPTVHAQIKNGGFEAQNFSEWKLERYTRSSSALTTVPPTNSSQLTLGAVQETIASTNTVNTAFGGNVRILTTAGTAANTGVDGVRYPFSGTASSQLGGNGARAAYSMEQEATMVLSDVDPVDGKVHLRFAMAPVLNNPNHTAGQQPFFFVEVINLTKGNTQLFHTFNYSNQSGIPWQSFGNYQFTNWQGFDISPGNGRLDVGDQIRLKVYVANCSAGAADHTAQVYMDVFGSKMPGLSVAAIGPSTTKPGEQVTYNYHYVNNSGVYALGSTVRLAAPFTENGLPLTFVPGSWPATCTGPFTGTAPRGNYIDCPVGDLVAGAGGSFPVTFTVPAGAATTGPNNVINNGDYDVRANTVSPFIGPLVKTTISPATTTLIDLGVSVSNGSVPSYLVGGAVAYTVTVTNNGPVDATGATIAQTLNGTSGTASWSCAPAPGSTATCGATGSGSGPISTATANLPVGQSLVYTVSGITATAAGTPVVTVVSVTPPAGMSDSVSANNTDGVSTPVSAAQHLLTANTIGAGSGRLNAIPAIYACPSGGARSACSSENLGEGQEAYLTAVADNGSIFKGWTGGCTTITGNECYVRMGTQDLEVTAEFATVWIVTPSVTGGTLNTSSPQVVEDGQGTSYTFTPTTPGHIPVITTPGGANTCQATLSGPTGGVYTYDVTPVTQDCAFHVAFVSQPRLEIAKTASVVAPATIAIGVPFDYTITVTNTGAAATSAPATVTDVVPAGLTIGTLPANCATNPSGSQTVECTIAAGLSNVAPGNAVSFVIPVTPQGAINNTTVSNTASVTGGGDPACASAGSCVSTPVDTPVVASSLDIVKSGPATAVIGVPYDYTFTVTNSGTAATSVIATVTDVVPAGLTIGTLPAGCVTNPSGSQTVECTIASGLSNAAPGNTVSYVIRVTPTAAAGTSVSNTASVTGGGDPDCVTGCDSQAVTTTINAPALDIAKSGPATAVTGVPFDYTITVTNSGNADATADAVVTDTVPASVVVNSATPNCTIVGQDVSCTVALADLQTGEQATITINVTPVTAGNANNTASVTGGGDPACTAGCTSPPVTTTIDAQLASMTLVKSVTSTGPYGVGSAIAYQFIVTNTGNVALTGVVVNDAQLDAPATCPVTTLAPGASTTCTGVHTVIAAEVAVGNVHNSATVTGQPPTPPGGPTPPAVTSPPSVVDTATAQAPAMTVVKSVTSSGPYGLGSVIAYQFVVTNTGDVTLSGVVVNDALLDGPATCPATTLAPGASTTCTGVHTVTAAEVAAGHVHNSATVTGQPPTPAGGTPPTPITSPPSSVDTATAQNPALGLVKSVTSTGPYGVGSVITYTFVVTNTGNVNLTGVVVNDALLDAAAVCAATTLAPAASTTCTGMHTVTAAEVAVGNVHNSATATGQPPTPPGGPTPPTVTSPPSAVDTATEQLPAMTVVKSVTSTGPYNTGSVIAYQFLVTNTGNVVLSGIVVNDTQLDAPAVCASTTLQPGVDTTCTGVHTVTAAEVAVGNVRNTATVTGQPPTPPGGPTPPTITSPPSTVDSATEQLPAMTLLKSVTSTGPYRAGSTIAYQFDVENTGNVVLTNVSVTDALAGLSPLTYAWPGVAGQLQPGEKVVANATYNVTPDDVLAGQVRNSATAAGQPPTPPGGTTPPGVSTPSSSVDTAILPVVNAVDDVLAPVDGARGNPSAGNAYDNDVINGVAVDPSRITGTVTTPATSINGGPVPVMDPASGVVSVPAGTPAGTYTIGYRICETLNPDNCDDAVVSLTVVATTINAEEDTFVPIRSGTGGTLPSVLGNDTLGGGPAQIGQVTLVPGGSPHAGLVMNPDGTVTIAAGTPPGTYRYPYTLCEVLNPTNCDTADAVVVVSGEALLRVTKTAGVRDVQTGDLVRYTVTVENLGDGALSNGSIIDTPAAGLSYVEGSLTVSDGDNAATVSGEHPVRFEGLDIPVGGTARLVYMMRVGAGARAGTQVNQAQAVSSSGELLSNVATAEVMLVADAMVDDSLVFGTVFNDRDGDGWQDGAALSGIRVQGGFAPEVYVAGSTTLDRGTGPQPQADASAPLLHGLEVGAMAGRQSEADPVQGRQVVIRQALRELSFTDDFVLTNDQGVTVRMDRNGVTSLETTGEAAKGLTAAMPTVERRVAQGEGGHVVDYVIGNAGIEERGVPGVRIATVEGLLIETDQFGRYHLAGLSGGAWERGRNVVLKVDPSTLPAGTRMTTDNPLLRRVTPGVPVRFDWGVVLPEQVIEGGSEQLELELGEVQFAPGSAALPPRYQPLVTAMAAKVCEHQGGEVVIQADGDNEGLAFDRANALKDALLAQLDGPATKALTVSVRARTGEPASLVAGVRGGDALLGTLLFDTDKATIRAEFAPLLDAMAAALERQGGGNVVIVGHADRRGSHAYNSALGMRRAKAVFDALAGRLGASARATLRVEIENDPVAPNGARK